MISWFKKLFTKGENLKVEKKEGVVSLPKAKEMVRQSIKSGSVKRANDKLMLAGLEARRVGRYSPPIPPKRTYPTPAPAPVVYVAHEAPVNDDSFFNALAVASLLNDGWTETKRTPVLSPAFEVPFTSGQGGEFGGGGASGSWAPEPTPAPAPAYEAPYVPAYDPPPAPAPSYSYSSPPAYEPPAPSPSYDWGSSSSSSDYSSSSSSDYSSSSSDSSSSWSSSD